MDFIVCLPISKGFDAVTVVVEKLSKHGHFILLKHLYTTRSIDDISIKEIIRHRGYQSPL